MLYFVQGVIQAYQLNFFKPHMDGEGIDADRLAIVASLVLLPFVIKWIYGIISDRFNLFGRATASPTCKRHGHPDRRIAGSMFAILQTMSDIGIGAGEGVATSLSDNLGFTGVFRWFALAIWRSFLDPVGDQAVRANV
jgi:hypothetical protein